MTLAASEGLLQGTAVIRVGLYSELCANWTGNQERERRGCGQELLMIWAEVTEASKVWGMGLERRVRVRSP